MSVEQCHLMAGALCFLRLIYHSLRSRGFKLNIRGVCPGAGRQLHYCRLLKLLTTGHISWQAVLKWCTIDNVIFALYMANGLRPLDNNKVPLNYTKSFPFPLEIVDKLLGKYICKPWNQHEHRYIIPWVLVSVSIIDLEILKLRWPNMSKWIKNIFFVVVAPQ